MPALVSDWRVLHSTHQQQQNSTTMPPIVNPYANNGRRNSQQQPRQSKKKAKGKYGAAQAKFIADVRHEIDTKGASFFKDKDWRCITPAGCGRYTGYCGDTKIHADSFYIRPLAMWVPHLLIPDFVPTCPTCESNHDVDVDASKWVKSQAKVMYGLKDHRYLDTYNYLCRSCGKHGKHFTGLNPRSMELDANELLGFFNFNFQGEDLCC